MEKRASFIQLSNYFTLLEDVFPENGESFLESVKQEIKDAEFYT